LCSNTTANDNTAVGYNSLFANTTGICNTAVGKDSLKCNTTASNNTAVGRDALVLNTTGTQNTALGQSAGFTVTTGSNLTLLGYNAEPSSATATNEITLGDANVTDVRIPGAGFYIDNGEVVFNEDGNDKDFRVESNTDSTAFFVDGANGIVRIGTGAGTGKLNVSADGFSTSSTNPHIVMRNNNQTGGVGTGDKTLIMGEVTAGGAVAVPYRPVAFGAENTQATLREGAFVVYVSDNNSVDLSTDERMRINSSGTVLVGKTTSSGNTEGISLAPTGNSNFVADQTSTLLLNRLGNTGDILNFRQGVANNVGSISVTASATAYNTSSDYRLKENVSYDFDATTRLKQLKPARFNFIADADRTVDGFLAHEVSSIVPEAISGTKDATETKEKVVLNANGQVIAENIEQADWETGKIADEDGNTQYPTDSTWEATKVVPVYQGIDQAKLVPLLVKTIQELEARITALENA
jgi:hypothetical protein